MEGPRGATAEQLLEHLGNGKHLIALRRHGMPQWRTLKRKTRAGVWFFPHGRTCHGSD